MKEQITLRLYEDPKVPTCRDGGRYHPDDLKGWDVSRGDTVPLTEDHGGRVFGVVDSVDDDIHTDQDGKRYKLASAWIQD
ncbi:MAG: hypothetical protein AAF086_07105 [Planctomycetota bacterium]